jgi:hypothetical protein
MAAPPKARGIDEIFVNNFSIKAFFPCEVFSFGVLMA